MDINQPRWKIPEYSKREINEAGATIRKASVSEEERTAALKIVDNWRSAHAYPLHVFYMNLRGKASAKKDILVAERLKRMESIVGKLCKMFMRTVKGFKNRASAMSAKR